MFRRSLAQIEGEREEALRMIAALEKHREVPRHLLTKEQHRPVCHRCPRPAAQRERIPAQGLYAALGQPRRSGRPGNQN